MSADLRPLESRPRHVRFRCTGGTRKHPEGHRPKDLLRIALVDGQPVKLADAGRDFAAWVGAAEARRGRRSTPVEFEMQCVTCGQHLQLTTRHMTELVTIWLEQHADVTRCVLFDIGRDGANLP